MLIFSNACGFAHAPEPSAPVHTVIPGGIKGQPGCPTRLIPKRQQLTHSSINITHTLAI